MHVMHLGLGRPWNSVQRTGSQTGMAPSAAQQAHSPVSQPIPMQLPQYGITRDQTTLYVAKYVEKGMQKCPVQLRS